MRERGGLHHAGKVRAGVAVPAAELDEFGDLIGRNFRQPTEGLGFDGSPVAHMWRTIIWPTRAL